MGYDYKELYEKIRDNVFSMKKGMSNTQHHTPYIERMKNVLYNNLEGIEAGLKYAAEAAKQIELLEVELADAERELDELTKKTTTQKKPKQEKHSDE